METTDCIFCKIIARQLPVEVVAENNEVVVIKDIVPKAPVHYLIIPKKHITDMSSLEQADIPIVGEMLLMAKSLQRD